MQTLLIQARLTRIITTISISTAILIQRRQHSLRKIWSRFFILPLTPDNTPVSVISNTLSIVWAKKIMKMISLLVQVAPSVVSAVSGKDDSNKDNAQA